MLERRHGAGSLGPTFTSRGSGGWESKAEGSAHSASGDLLLGSQPAPSLCPVEGGQGAP